jgi:hypothetical protein
MADEITELHEHAEHAQHDSTMVPVTLTMAILAVLVAVVALLGHRAHNEELLNQARASDTWSEYQAKSIRRHAYEVFVDQLSVSSVADKTRADQLAGKYSREAQRYAADQDKLREKAQDFEEEVRHEARRAARFDLGEVLLEAALVITSVTLITRRRGFWIFGLVLTVAGLAIAVRGLIA